MPTYEFKCSKCEEIHEIYLNRFIKDEEKKQVCPKCGGNSDLIFSQCFGTDKNAEPWQYDYTHKVKPKFVKDHNGNKIKFNPNTMGKGRKGLGQ